MKKHGNKANKNIDNECALWSLTDSLLIHKGVKAKESKDGMKESEDHRQRKRQITSKNLMWS